MDKFISNRNYAAIRTLCKPISRDFASNNKTEIMLPFHKVWPWIKLKDFMYLVLLD